MRKLPFAINDTEGNVLVRRAGAEKEQNCIIIPGFFDDFVSGSLGLVDEIGVENVELLEKRIKFS